MTTPRPSNLWASGDTYEAYVGRWSRLVAPEFLRWLNVPVGKRWLDVGCGTGVLTTAILDTQAPAEVHGVDRSDAFVEHARAHVAAERATFDVADAQALPAGDARFDVVVSGLVLNFVPDHARALEEMARVVRPGGTVGIYVWDYAGEMQLMRHFWDAAIELDPAARELDEGRRSPICDPAALQALLSHYFEDVDTAAVIVPTTFRDFDDYWTPFLAGGAPAPAYCMSLDEERRTRLRESLRARLPVTADGSIPLTARAWTVKGRRPA